MTAQRTPTSGPRASSAPSRSDTPGSRPVATRYARDRKTRAPTASAPAVTRSRKREAPSWRLRAAVQAAAPTSVASAPAEKVVRQWELGSIQVKYEKKAAETRPVERETRLPTARP